jgi:release factor glutamine methyltransferase
MRGERKSEAVMTVAALRTRLRKSLAAAGIDMSELEASELLAAASGFSKQELIRQANAEVSAETVMAAEALLSRRLSGEPLAYIIGQWDFCGLTLEITPDVLIPRTDTEFLAERAWHVISRYNTPHVLDLCSGSGCIGLSVASRFRGAHVTLCDCSPPALALSRRNADRLQLQVNYLRHDMLQSPPPGRWDVIVCNPPYVRRDELPLLDPSVRDFEPRTALDGGEDGLDFYRALSEWHTECLRSGGTILLECGQGQAHDITALFAPAETEIFSDTRGIDRVICVNPARNRTVT